MLAGFDILLALVLFAVHESICITNAIFVRVVAVLVANRQRDADRVLKKKRKRDHDRSVKLRDSGDQPPNRFEDTSSYRTASSTAVLYFLSLFANF